MSDNADIANDLMQERLDRILQNRPQSTVGVSAVECEECGDPIAPARREALPGVQTCIECAQLLAEQLRFKNGG
jgi:phage/conjugal plasmid C-4 type zinc finger TraR family protein